MQTNEGLPFSLVVPSAVPLDLFVSLIECPTCHQSILAFSSLVFCFCLHLRRERKFLVLIRILGVIASARGGEESQIVLESEKADIDIHILHVYLYLLMYSVS